jgi:hypothetical protein
MFEENQSVGARTIGNFMMNGSLNRERIFILDETAALKCKRAGVGERHEVSLKVDSRPC